MKRSAIVFCLLLLSALSIHARQPVNPNAPKIKLDPEVLDYGTIEMGSNPNREVKCTNVGKEPLILSNVQTSCCCMVADWPKEPIKPGATVVIKIKYDTKRVGPFTKMVTITSNAEESYKVLKVKGAVKPPPVVVRDSVDLKTDN